MEYFIISIVSFFVGVLITRWIFSIKQFLKYQKFQVQVILEIAKKLEVDKARLNIIVDKLKR